MEAEFLIEIYQIASGRDSVFSDQVVADQKLVVLTHVSRAGVHHNVVLNSCSLTVVPPAVGGLLNLDRG